MKTKAATINIGPYVVMIGVGIALAVMTKFTLFPLVRHAVESVGRLLSS